MPDKRTVSVLIPFRKQNGKIFVYLQKREEYRERSPGLFGFFGGGVEHGESPEMALQREIKEEMDIDLEEPVFFGSYNFERALLYVFTIEVDDNFERRIKIQEGEYGKFLRAEEVDVEKRISDWDRAILADFFNKTQ